MGLEARSVSAADLLGLEQLRALLLLQDPGRLQCALQVFTEHCSMPPGMAAKGRWLLGCPACSAGTCVQECRCGAAHGGGAETPAHRCCVRTWSCHLLAPISLLRREVPGAGPPETGDAPLSPHQLQSQNSAGVWPACRGSCQSVCGVLWTWRLDSSHWAAVLSLGAHAQAH